MGKKMMFASSAKAERELGFQCCRCTTRCALRSSGFWRTGMRRATGRHAMSAQWPVFIVALGARGGGAGCGLASRRSARQSACVHRAAG